MTRTAQHINGLGCCAEELQEFDPVEMLTQISSHFEKIASTGALDDSSHSALRNLIQQTNSLGARTATVDELVTPLAARTGCVHRQATALVSELQPGYVRAQDEMMARLTESSPLLRSMWQAGIALSSLRVFSADERRIANELMGTFTQCHEAWQALKVTLSGRGEHVKVKKEEYEGTVRFLKRLEALGFLRVAESELYVYGQKAWKGIKGQKIRYLKSDSQPIRIRIEDVDNARISFITGNWLSAYVERLISEQLSRNGVCSETYSMVSFATPRDRAVTCSDFDVVVSAKNRAMFIECKGGKLTTPEALDKIVSDARSVRDCWSIDPSSSQFRAEFILVFDDTNSDAEFVRQALEGTGVDALTPDELRYKVTRELVQ